MSTNEPRIKPAGNPVAKMFGAMLMAIGGLIATLCGLCSLGFIGWGIVSSVGQPNGEQALIYLVPILIIDAIPIGIGVLLFLGGRSLYRNN